MSANENCDELNGCNPSPAHSAAGEDAVSGEDCEKLVKSPDQLGTTQIYGHTVRGESEDYIFSAGQTGIYQGNCGSPVRVVFPAGVVVMEDDGVNTQADADAAAYAAALAAAEAEWRRRNVGSCHRLYLSEGMLVTEFEEDGAKVITNTQDSDGLYDYSSARIPRGYSRSYVSQSEANTLALSKLRGVLEADNKVGWLNTIGCVSYPLKSRRSFSSQIHANLLPAGLCGTGGGAIYDGDSDGEDDEGNGEEVIGGALCDDVDGSSVGKADSLSTAVWRGTVASVIAPDFVPPLAAGDCKASSVTYADQKAALLYNVERNGSVYGTGFRVKSMGFLESMLEPSISEVAEAIDGSEFHEWNGVFIPAGGGIGVISDLPVVPSEAYYKLLSSSGTYDISFRLCGKKFYAWITPIYNETTGLIDCRLSFGVFIGAELVSSVWVGYKLGSAIPAVGVSGDREFKDFAGTYLVALDETDNLAQCFQNIQVTEFDLEATLNPV